VKSLDELVRETRVLDLGPLPAPRLAPASTLHQALQMMTRARRGAVVAVDGSKPTGILTERDVVLGDLSSWTTREQRNRILLREVMSAPPVTVRRQATLAEAIETMTERGYRHLVVVDRHGDLRGLLYSTDLVQFVTDQFPEDTVNLPPRLRQQYNSPEGA
jgi:CBS domain-containing protein